MKYLSFQAVSTIKNNVDYFFDFFSKSNYMNNIEKELSSDFCDTSRFPDVSFEFFMPDDGIKEKMTDFNNCVEVFNKLSYLSESQASDERYWAGLAIEEQNMNYLFYRWGKTEKTIKYRVTYHESGKRGFMYHGLARLWWLAYLTRDETLTDPFELTRFTFQYPHIMEKMIYRNFSNSRVVRMATIKAIRRFIEEGGHYSTKKIDLLYKYIGILGSSTLLDICDEDYIITRLLKFLNEK